MSHEEQPPPLGAVGGGSALMKRKSLDPQSIIALESDIFKIMKGDTGNDANSNKPPAIKESLTVGSLPTSMESYGTDTPEHNQSQPTKSSGCCSKTLQTTKPKGPYSEYSIKNKSEDLLPQQAQEDQGKITLVVDVDETLVHSGFTKIKDPDFSFILNVDPHPMEVSVAVRPFAKKFFEVLGPLYEIVIFSAANQKYLEEVINRLDPNHYVKYTLTKTSCVNLNGAAVKDLSRLCRDLKKMIIIDNSPVSYLLQPYNAIPISSWYDDKNDRELEEIISFLETNHGIDDVYSVLVQPTA